MPLVLAESAKGATDGGDAGGGVVEPGDMERGTTTLRRPLVGARNVNGDGMSAGAAAGRPSLQ